MSAAHFAFRLAILARLYRWAEDDFEEGFIATLPTREFLKHELTARLVLKGRSPDYSWLSDVDGSDPQVPGAPSSYVVYLGWAKGARVFKTDGTVDGGYCDDLDQLQGWRWLDSPSQILRNWAFE